MIEYRNSMDCFKLQAETLQYLQQQTTQFNTIIALIHQLTLLDEPIFACYDCYQMHAGGIVKNTQYQQYIKGKEKRQVDGEVEVQAELELGLEWEDGIIDSAGDIQEGTGGIDGMYETFWGLVGKRGTDREEKYRLVLEIAYAYFRISSTKASNPSQTQSQQCQKQQQPLSLVQKQFQQYLKQFTSTNGYQIPPLVNYCYRLQQINRVLAQTRDLVIVRKMCAELKELIVGGLSRNAKLKERDANANTNNANREPTLVGSGREMHSDKKLKRITRQQSKIAQNSTLGVQKVQNNYEQMLFLWRVDSLLLLTAQLLQKNPYTKPQLLAYLKTGRMLREHFSPKAPTLLVSMLQKMVTTYSNIMKYSTKLKMCKYYDMLAMEMEIGYRMLVAVMRKEGREDAGGSSKCGEVGTAAGNGNGRRGNCSSRSSIWNFQGFNNNIKDKCLQLPTKANDPKTNPSNNTQKPNKPPKQPIPNFKTPSPPPLSPSNNINNEYIEQQINQITQKNYHDACKQYTEEDPIRSLEQKYSQLDKEKKRRAIFFKSLDHLTKRSYHYGSQRDGTPSGRYHISLHEKKNKTKSAATSMRGSPANSGNIFQSFSSRSGGIFKSLQQSSKPKPNPNYPSPYPRAAPGQKPRTRQGVLIRRHSFKREIINLISITKRNIKPGRYFNEIKDAENNLYRAILSTEKRVAVLTREKLEDEIGYLHRVAEEKATPIEEEILVFAGTRDKGKTGKKEDQDCYSFKGIGLNLSMNSTNSNPSNTQTFFMDPIQQHFQLTMIQCLGRELGFIRITTTKNPQTGENSHQIRLTSYQQGISGECLTIVADGMADTGEFVNCRTSFTFEDLRKEVITSQFYFELIQENLQKNIEGADVQALSQYAWKLSQSQLQQQQRQNQTQSLIQQQYQKSRKLQSALFICIKRMAYSMFYWYYTKARKINGSIFIKRQIPTITDSLKFAIALDFMKKYTHKECLQKLSNVRNKKALYQCFRYMLYGRKIIVKGIINRKNSHVFYVLSLESFSDRQFQIRNSEEGGSSFQDLNFVLKLYEMGGFEQLLSMAWPVNQFLSAREITLLALSNIIQHQITRKYLTTLTIAITQKQSTPIHENDRTHAHHTESIIEPNSEQRDSLIKLYKANMQKFVNEQIVSFSHLIRWYIDIIGGAMNLCVLARYQKICKIEGEYFCIRELHLGCGLIVQLISALKGRGRQEQVAIYDAHDLKAMRYRHRLEHGERGNAGGGARARQKEQSSKIISLENITRNKRKKMTRMFSYNRKQTQKVDNSFLCNPNRYARTHTHNFPSIPVSQKQWQFHPSKQSQHNLPQNPLRATILQCQPQYSIRRSPFHTRIVIKQSNHSSRRLVNKIKKTTIQKYQMEPMEILGKKVVRVAGKYLYACLGYNTVIRAYRADLYDTAGCRKFGAFWRMEEFGARLVHSCASNYGRNQENEINMDADPSYYRSYYGFNQQGKHHQNQSKKDRIQIQQHYDEDHGSFNFGDQGHEKSKFCHNHNPSTKRFKDNYHQQKEIMLQLFNKGKMIVSECMKNLTIMLDRRDYQPLEPQKYGVSDKTGRKIVVPIFQSYYSLSNFEGHNKGKIQLLQLNTKLLLLIILEHSPQPHYAPIDDNPWINNVNIFADFQAKEHKITLYSDLFMRMYVKFRGNSLDMRAMGRLRELEGF